MPDDFLALCTPQYWHNLSVLAAEHHVEALTKVFAKSKLR